jgi:hypothetical protein
MSEVMNEHKFEDGELSDALRSATEMKSLIERPFDEETKEELKNLSPEEKLVVLYYEAGV